MRMKLQCPTSQEAMYILVSIFLNACPGEAYKSQSLLLGLDGRIDLSAGSGISHFVVSVL